MLKKYFIPHKKNQHQPFFLRRKAVFAILSFVLVLEIAFLALIWIVFPKSDLLSSILPNVLVDLTNQDRQANNIGLLATNSLLEKAAQLKANDMAARGYFAHTSPDGRSPWYWFDQVGYSYVEAGENLAVNFFDSADIDKAWMNSLTHKENILRANFNEIGIATARGIYKGKETIFVVQLFGRPVVSQAEPAVKEKPVAPSKPASQPPKGEVPKKENASVLGQSELIAGQENFISSGQVNNIGQNDEGAAVKPVQPSSSFLERMFSEPRSLINIIYAVLASIVLAAIALKIFVKIKIQYPLLIFNGVLMLFCIVSIFYLNYLISGWGVVF